MMFSFAAVGLRPSARAGVRCLDKRERRPAGSRLACRYLGLADDGARHQDEPSNQHRCYFLDQQDRIDAAHQAAFCLTAKHRACPWQLWRPQIASRNPLKSAWTAALTGVVLLVVGIGALVGSGTVARSGAHIETMAAATKAPDLIPFPLPVDAASVPSGLDRLPSTPHTIPGTALTTSIFTATAPKSVTASLSTTVDGLVVAGNVAFFFPRDALASLAGPLNVEVTANPPDVPLPGGIARLGANNSLFATRMTDGLGRRVTTLPHPAAMIVLYNHTDLAVARDDPNTLAAGYLLDRTSPQIANPLGLAPGTWLFFAPSLTHVDVASGTLLVETQVVPSIASIINRTAGEVEAMRDNLPLLSGPTPDAVVLGLKPRFSRFTVVEPQIGTRLLVRDPDTNNYAFVNTTEVGLRAASS